ncbi:MAG: hypothetical protein GX184_00645 [Clostridiaceae bacterium]|mgnify:CR=1 FL=1|nr:hypothetical protein [Clostridiaceae bacterium]
MNKFEQFLKHRQSLLLQFKMGDMTKNEFIQENFNYMEKIGIKPFTRIDNVKKAVYNYHYFNVNAKYWQWMANDPKNSAKERDAYYAQAHTYYSQKDRATMALLRLLDFNVEAYYVNVRSQVLKNKLIEIVIKDPDILLEIDPFHSISGLSDNDYLILHTKSIVIANALRENRVLKESKQQSLTDDYINQKY